ncbi:unnamed protein product [Amoebophrya sp. A120]|nr:unnamed protein product [Amoebophrya sp. A120]|eukprot:GSA120T00024732001.1
MDLYALSFYCVLFEITVALYFCHAYCMNSSHGPRGPGLLLLEDALQAQAAPLTADEHDEHEDGQHMILNPRNIDNRRNDIALVHDDLQLLYKFATLCLNLETQAVNFA